MFYHSWCLEMYLNVYWHILKWFENIWMHSGYLGFWSYVWLFRLLWYFWRVFLLLLLFEFVHDIWRFFVVPCGSLIFEVFLEFLWEILCDSCDADSCDYSHRHFKILLTSFQDELWDNFRFILRTWRLFWGFSRDSRGSILIFGGISRFFWDSLATSAPLYVENVPQVT